MDTDLKLHVHLHVLIIPLTLIMFSYVLCQEPVSPSLVPRDSTAWKVTAPLPVPASPTETRMGQLLLLTVTLAPLGTGVTTQVSSIYLKCYTFTLTLSNTAYQIISLLFIVLSS